MILARRRSAALSIAAIAVAVLAVTTSGGGPRDRVERASAPTELTALESSPPKLALSPPSGARDVQPRGAAWAAATSGVLTDVRMVNEQGRLVAGRMNAAGTAWTPTEPLGYGRTYTLTASISNQ